MTAGAKTSVALDIVGEKSEDRLRWKVVLGKETRFGRAPRDGLKVPWDRAISREHGDLHWDGEKMRVRCLDSALNALEYNDQALREISISIGEEFQVGATCFQLIETESDGDSAIRADAMTATLDESDADAVEESYAAEELRQVSFGDPAQQMELLAELPEMISNAGSDEDLAAMLTGILLDAIPQAESVAVAQFDKADLQSDQKRLKPLMMRTKTREGFEGRFLPSQRLIRRALQTQNSVIHIWTGGEGGVYFTMTAGLGWAFCCPILGESSRGWCLYVSGAGSSRGGVNVSHDDLKSDLRFTELVAQFLGAIRQVRLLQEQKTQLSAFFSPQVVQQVTRTGGRPALAPAERNISVLFCDVRGFSRKAESMSGDLEKLLASVSKALDVMASGILDHNGTIADFQGDAALGFWGWPMELEEGPLPACHAALHIERAFRRGSRDPNSLLHGFSVGIGIVHGRAIAGQIGTARQAKVGVFGPVVNQGARLESLTKQINTPICIDEATAEWVRREMTYEQARVRRLMPIQPVGMDYALNAFGLLPPEHEYPKVTNASITAYELALDAAIAGDWPQTRQQLEKVPDSDGPKRFLLEQIIHASERPKSDWDGVFRLTRK